ISYLQFGSISRPRSFRAAQAIVQDDLWGWISVRSSDVHFLWLVHQNHHAKEVAERRQIVGPGFIRGTRKPK
ncbi:MAG: hypothetical protein AAFQ98_22110, partial [Bacteroidota bacterium]